MIAAEIRQTSDFVMKKITYLCEIGGKSASKAALASLRRGIGKEPGSLPELWDVTFDKMPEALLSINDEPSKGERASYTALTLFALHQQGGDPKSKCMCKEGESLGKAVSKLANLTNEEAVLRRFNAAATSDSYQELTWHLKGLVQLLKANGLTLDYPALAEDLYRFQFSECRDGVRLKWGRDYYRYKYNDTEETETGKESIK